MSPPGSRSPVPPWMEGEDVRITMTSDDAAMDVWDAWLAALSECYHLAKGERLGELRGRRVKLLDARGLHPYSLAWGRVLALEKQHPGLSAARLSDPPTDPVRLRRVAQRDAERAFYDELVEGGPEVFQ